MVISLSGVRPVTEGSKRLIFVHPDDPALLIKVIKPGPSPKFTWAPAMRRRHVYTSSLLRELEQQALLRMNDPYPLPFLQKIVGFADTDLGLGLVVRVERAADGRFAPSLSQLVKAGRFDREAEARLEAFFKAIQASPVVAGDLNVNNVVYSLDPVRGQHFVLIDGIGDKTLIPICKLSPFLNRQAKRRKIARMREWIANWLAQDPGRA